MDIPTILTTIMEIGITPALLIVFVKYFLDINKQQSLAFREQAKSLFSESLRREELIKEEASKREAILRQESAKRESCLLLNIEKLGSTFEKIAGAMDTMNKSAQHIECEIITIDRELERIVAHGAARNCAS